VLQLAQRVGQLFEQLDVLGVDAPGGKGQHLGRTGGFDLDHDETITTGMSVFSSVW
jgi:hypothetical protein